MRRVVVCSGAFLGAVAALALAATMPAAGAPKPYPAIGSCTMAVPLAQATVEAEIANAADFCELVSQALAVDVFGTAVIVTPGLTWHYVDSTLSCRLWYGHTGYRLTVRNSPAACRWLIRLAPEWHVEAVATAWSQRRVRR
jgi:hypothetical protein